MASKRTLNKISVVYNAQGRYIEYVGRTPSELLPEYKRVCAAVDSCARITKTLLRSPHPAVRAAYYQLLNCDVSIPEPPTNQNIADAIARVSYTLEDTMLILAKISNSNIEPLRELRFHLTYGQTPKKRDRNDIIITRAVKEKYEDEPSPEVD